MKIKKNVATTFTTDIAELKLEDIESAYKSLLETDGPIVEKIKVTRKYFATLKKEIPSTEITPLWGIPVVIDPTLKVPFKFEYRKFDKKN